VQPSTEQNVQVYWLNNVNNRIEVVPSSITLKDADKPSEILEAAFNSLLTGPANPAFATTIPKGTKLRKLSLEADGVHVDLSKEFTAGGGSASMTGRVAQVLYTASSLDPAAKVWIEVEGTPLEVLGGEGLMLDQPLTRENFKKNFEL
jgi:spore germination protein GerM